MGQRLSEEQAKELLGGYPWEEWSDGEWWVVDAVEEYGVQPMSLRSTIYRYADRNGLRAETRTPASGDRREFQVAFRMFAE